MSSAVCLLLSAHVCQFELELGRTRAYPMQTGGSGYSRVEYLHRRPHMGGGRGTSIHIPAPVAGLGLAAGASMLLWWNEKRTAETERMLREARAELSGRRRGGGGSRGGGGLQYWAGALNSADGVADDIFPEVHWRAAKLRRLTEVYQWHAYERSVRHALARRPFGAPPKSHTIFAGARTVSTRTFSKSGRISTLGRG